MFDASVIGQFIAFDLRNFQKFDLGLILFHSLYLIFILQWSTVTVGEVAITIVIIMPVAEFSEHRAQTLLISAPVILTGTPEKIGVRLDTSFEFFTLETIDFVLFLFVSAYMHYFSTRLWF